ncbi:MAG: hypothetical protein H6523_07325 [Mycolicibacterium sp.]|jgi:hypothetical protein|uniref:hypothetical protein n=1 Tax=Mycolicibacterium insubricum TaxID=444597 RepID=UPI00105434B0|nr:hypothetical protein [Mycolicibacterium insubricum]MCB9440044.1 hypothetical protein [Mycolicibacterium sp.]
MTTARSTTSRLTATVGAAFALAFAAAGPAAAGGPPNTGPVTPMSGAYTAQHGDHPSAVWVFTPCGEGCSQVRFPNGKTAQANAADGQWRLDELDNPNAVQCVSDGSEHPGDVHYAWDATTLTGSLWSTDDDGSCGAPPVTDTGTEPFRLQPAD